MALLEYIPKYIRHGLLSCTQMDENMTRSKQVGLLCDYK
jgi:hypothetical protein